MIVVGIILLLMALLVGWLLTVVGLPGNWLMLLSTSVYALSVPSDRTAAILLPTIVVLGILAVVGELLETMAGAMGAAQVGGSKRAAALSLIGSFIGGIFGIFVSLPIPIPWVAQLISAVVFACLGALIGAVLGEKWKGRSLKQCLQVGAAALGGRLLGTLAKMLIGSVMAIIAIIALCFEQI